MNLTHFYQGFEKAATFTLIGLLVNSQFSFKQPILKTATIIAGATYCVCIVRNDLSNSPNFHQEEILMTSAIITAGAYKIYDVISTLIGVDPNYDG